MQALIAPLKELAEYDEIRKVTRQGKGTVALSGCVDSQKLHMIYGLSDGLKYKVIVTYSDLKAKEIYEEYRFYDRNVMLYPAKDLIFFQADIHGNQLVQERIKTLRFVHDASFLRRKMSQHVVCQIEVLRLLSHAHTHADKSIMP